MNGSGKSDIGPINEESECPVVIARASFSAGMLIISYAVMKAVVRRLFRNRHSWVFLLCLILGVGLAGCLLNRPPIAVLNAPVISGSAPLEIPFDLSYCGDPDGDKIVYVLDFGDESEPINGEAFNIIVHHTYHAGGAFTATLTVADAQGNEANDQLSITVSDAGPPVGLDVGETAPDFTAHTTDGQEITLSEYRGFVVLIDFWGAWCPPCRSRMPHLQDLYDQYASQGLVVLLVSTDREKQDAIDFLSQNGYTDFVSLWEPGYKSQNPIAALYEVDRFPHTFLLDRQGVIRYVGHPDYLAPEIIEGLL